MILKINLIPRDETNLQWFCLRTEPNRETIARRHLSSWIDADNIYMPECERYTVLETTKSALDPDEPGKTITVSTGSQRVKGLILRGYLFVRLTMFPRAANEIANTAGVLELMPDNFNPRPLTDEEFLKLKTSCETLSSSSIPEENYEWMIGKTHRVTSGTYAGFSGECCDIVKAHAVLKLEMFKNVIPVPVPVECIEAPHVSLTRPEEENHIVKSKRFGYKQDFNIAR